MPKLNKSFHLKQQQQQQLISWRLLRFYLGKKNSTKNPSLSPSFFCITSTLKIHLSLSLFLFTYRSFFSALKPDNSWNALLIVAQAHDDRCAMRSCECFLFFFLLQAWFEEKALKEPVGASWEIEFLLKWLKHTHTVFFWNEKSFLY